MRVVECRSHRIAALWLLFLLAAPVVASEQSASAAGLRLYGTDSTQFIEAPRLRTDVRIAVSGLLARVRVVQAFTNPGDDWVEGVYLFPLPDDAAVDHLRMRYAGRVIEGEIREKAQAQREYEVARAQGKAATLLDQQRANMFTTHVANIPPHATVEVEVEYQQQARWQEQAFSLRFPMVVAPRYIPGSSVAADAAGDETVGHSAEPMDDVAAITTAVVAGADDDFNPLSLSVELDAGVPLQQVDSLYHEITASRLSASRYHVTLAAGSVPAERDFVLQWRPEASAEPTAALFTQRWDTQHYALLMLMPPQASETVASVARELTLVVDTSGSMHGDSIEQAKAALRFALTTLQAGDRFNIVQFNDSVYSLFNAPRPADARHLALARAYVDGLRAEGGTEMAPALRRALDGRTSDDGRLRQVVFLTDGAVGNEQALFELIAQRLGNRRLFTVGIGSAPNALFMRHAARHGRGTFSYIGAVDEVADVMGRLFRQLASPALTDIRLHWTTAGTDDVVEQTPTRVGDLYATEPLVVAVRSPHPTSQLHVEGLLGGRPWQHTLATVGGEDADGVHVLWARRAIDEHLAGLSLGADADSVRRAVVDIALQHHLVSRYTSLVAVDRTPSRAADEALQQRRVASRLPAGWSDHAVYGRMPGTATTAPLALVLGLCGVALGVWLRRWA